MLIGCMNVFYEEDGHFKVASVMSETEASLQVESLTGKRSKIKAANILLRFESALNGFMEAAQQEAETLDTDFLWECCGEAEFGFEDLAKDYYGAKPTSVQSAATAIKVHSAPIYFYRKGKGHYKAAPAETLKLALAAVERKKLQAEQMAAWVAQLNNKQLPEGFANKADVLIYNPDKNSLEWKAIEEAARSSGRLALSVMFDAGLITNAHDYHLGAFLREMFPEKNGKHGTEFGEFEEITIPQDLPLAKAEAFSIDDATTNEIDDAFSLEILSNGNTRVGIHIAAPALSVKPDTALDAIVLKRLSTVYMPGNKITMLPESVVRPFSLDVGETKPVLSLYCEVTPAFEVISHESKIEKIKIAENLRHDSLEPLFNANTLAEHSGHSRWNELKFLHDFAESLEKARGKFDPNRAPQIDYNFYVTDGIVSIVPRERGSPMDKLVAELMIYANSTWGEDLQKGGFAGIYRAQTGGKVFMTTEATPHQGLGVAQYAWSTSPLRRAVDLINQRQMIALLNKEPAPYTVKDGKLQTIIRDFELTYTAYSDFQTRMERYWCLQYLIQEKLTEVTATVWRENLVRIDGMFYITKVPSLPELKVGTKVLLEIKHIDTLLMELNCKFKQVMETEVAEMVEVEDAEI
jgi:exoribonuclease II